MRLATFIPRHVEDAGPRVGALLADDVSLIDLMAASAMRHGAAPAWLADMLSLLDAGESAMDQVRRWLDFAERDRPAGATIPLNSVTLLAPVPRPRSIRDCMAFERHLIQSTRTAVKWRSPWLATLDRWFDRVAGRSLFPVPKVWYEQPLYYKGNPHSVVGPEAEIVWPAYTKRLDYELEFGVFIGRKGRNIAAQETQKHIAGYTIFNDFSARDVQLREMQGRLGPAKGKDFDTGNAMGPYLVTPDEVPDPYRLRMLARVNGQEWSQGTTAEMRYTFEEMIAYISQDETLYPGEFIGSGTVPNGCGLELDRWLAAGDVVELEIERLGILRNRVRA